jgi:SAM-dependent methyltransferase
MAALLPASGWAQVRGVAAEAGLGLSAAPVPVMAASALQLSPGVLSAASLSPALSSPSPLLTPALAVAVRPAAAAAPDKPGSDQARAAATALFDGAALSAPAAGDGPSAPSAAPEHRRSSGLSPPTDAELVAVYRAARPQSNAVETFGRDFVGAAGQAIQKYTFMGEYFLQQLRPGAVFKAAEDLIKTHDAREDASSRRFMELLGRWQAFQDHGQEKLIAMKIAMMKRLGQPGPARNLPPSPIPGGEYWDMAAGMNAQGFIHRELEPGTNYSFFDYSPFVVSYLRTAAALAGAKNAVVVEADLNRLTRPAQPIAVLRTKNAVHYVPGFDKKLEEMADWIAPGGQLIIQNDPNPGQRSIIIEKHGPLVRSLIAEGWEFEYGFSGSPGNWGGYALDTMTLTRPKLVARKTAEQAAGEWSSYERAVQYLQRRFDPLDFLFR